MNQSHVIFGVEISLDKIDWVEVLLRINQSKRERYFIFNKDNLLQILGCDESTLFIESIKRKFIMLINSYALINVVTEQPEITNDTVVVVTDCPELEIKNYYLDDIISELQRKSNMEFAYYFSGSGRWKDRGTLYISLPYAIDYSSGKTVYEYDAESYEQITRLFSLGIDYPDKLIIFDDQCKLQTSVTADYKIKQSFLNFRFA